jgi:hypothetical protein
MGTGWEYRHWDDMLKLLAGATIGHYGEVKESTSASPLAIVQHNWAKVFESGKHELVEVWAEGKSIEALKLLLSGASKVCICCSCFLCSQYCFPLKMGCSHFVSLGESW